MIDYKYFKEKLLSLRKETLAVIQKDKEGSQPVQLDQSTMGRLSRIDAIQQQEMALATKRRRELLINQIDQALKRIESEDYGYCIRCGEEIAPGRLDLSPTISTCVQCA